MTISYNDFRKTELRIAKVLSAERIEGSEKLLKLRVSIGAEERQIIAGIGRKPAPLPDGTSGRTGYAPEDLIGKNIVIVANLEPRQLMGLESQGMLLAASNDAEGPILLTTAGDIAPGSEVR